LHKEKSGEKREEFLKRTGGIEKKKKRNFLLFKIETGILLFFFSLSAYFACIMHPRR